MKHEEDPRVLEITIPAHKLINNITYYQVICITNIKEYDKCYSRVYRRYTQFRHLHNVLSKKMVLPEFPKKRIFMKNENVVRERTAMLSVWLRYAAQFVDDKKCYKDDWGREVLRFLQEEKYP